MSHPTPQHIFLSYSRKDTDVMQRVRDDLRAAGLTVWTDEELTPGTPSWKSSIERAIENSACLVVLMSPDAKGSQWIERELDYARAHDLPIFPALTRGSERDAIPFVLINVEWADLRSDYASGIRQLTSAVQKYTQTSPRPAAANAPVSVNPNIVMPDDDQKLDAWNLFDQFRVLWGLFLAPGQIIGYKVRDGDEPVRQTGFWLVGSLAWFTIISPIIGYALGTVQMPQTTDGVRPSLLLVGLLLIAGWVISGLLSRRTDYAGAIAAFVVTAVSAFGAIAIIGSGEGIVFSEGGGWAGNVHTLLFGLELGIAFGVSFAVASGSIGIPSGILIGSVVFGAVFNKPPGSVGGIASVILVLVTFAVVTALKGNLKAGQLSWLSRGVAIVAVLSYAFAIWLYFLGGWPVLVGMVR